jgi:cell division septation protein DedD
MFQQVVTLRVIYFFITIIMIIGMYELYTRAKQFSKDTTDYSNLPVIYASNEKIRLVPDKNKKNRDHKIDKMIYNFMGEEESYQIKDHAKHKVKIAKTKLKRLTTKNQKKRKSAKAGEVVQVKDQQVHISKNQNISKFKKSSNNYIQLGAFRSKVNAENAWITINNDLPKTFERHNYIIEKVKLTSKGTLYRLQIGPFANEKVAQKFCIRLRKKGKECFFKLS